MFKSRSVFDTELSKPRFCDIQLGFAFESPKRRIFPNLVLNSVLLLYYLQKISIFKEGIFIAISHRPKNHSGYLTNLNLILYLILHYKCIN